MLSSVTHSDVNDLIGKVRDDIFNTNNPRIAVKLEALWTALIDLDMTVADETEQRYDAINIIETFEVRDY